MIKSISSIIWNDNCFDMIHSNSQTTFLSVKVAAVVRNVFLFCLLFSVHDKKALFLNRPSNSDFNEFIPTNELLERVSFFPPVRPNETHPIDPNKANQWIGAHPPEKRDLASKFIQYTQHINQTVFEENLERSVEKFNNWLKAQPSRDYFIFTTNQKANKSNRWVAELALPFLSIFPLEFVAYKSMDSQGRFSEEDFLKTMVYMNKKNTKTIVLFDDGAYSGMQSAGITLYINFVLSKFSPQNFYKIVWIIPFITKKAEDKIKSCNSPNSEIFIFKSMELPILRDFFSKKECENFNFDCWKSPVYFDHKIPDSMSSFPNIYEKGELCEWCNDSAVGRLTQGAVKPPYKEDLNQISQC